MSNEFKNLLIAVLLSVIVLGGWQYFYDAPRYVQLEKAQTANNLAASEAAAFDKSSETNEGIKTEDAGSITINTDKLEGVISLKGLRFDNLLFKQYKETLAENSPLVELFSSQPAHTYFAEFGWLNGSNDQTVPDKNTIWKCDSDSLTTEKPVSCYWNNKNSVHYFIDISIDQNYLFTIKQTVDNKSANSISIAGYGRIYKSYSEPKQFAILHDGAIGVFADVLKEFTYEDLDKEQKIIFDNSKGSWAGITSKYWLAALAPDSNVVSKTSFVTSAAPNTSNPHNVYNINYISQDINLAPGKSFKTENHLFAGAKVEELLSHYEKTKNFVLFDHAIDFGILYFLTKPLLLLISYLHSLLGNFGLAIMAVTLIIKLLMYPLASKSFSSMSKMKEMQPRIEQLKQRCGDDKVKLNQEMMSLYKKENINPAAGCLPLIIQIPVFFALYKVIFISIEMRHAPFYGWIHDLSVADPTSIWNLFGLAPWHAPDFISIGAWPIIMGATMFIQQRLSPAPADPIQATVMKFMPLLLVVMLYSLPSGLMIYWSFSNILSILQQYTINKRAASKSLTKN